MIQPPLPRECQEIWAVSWWAFFEWGYVIPSLDFKTCCFKLLRRKLCFCSCLHCCRSLNSTLCHLFSFHLAYVTVSGPCCMILCQLLSWFFFPSIILSVCNPRPLANKLQYDVCFSLFSHHVPAHGPFQNMSLLLPGWFWKSNGYTVYNGFRLKAR